MGTRLPCFYSMPRQPLVLRYHHKARMRPYCVLLDRLLENLPAPANDVHLGAIFFEGLGHHKTDTCSWSISKPLSDSAENQHAKEKTDQ